MAAFARAPRISSHVFAGELYTAPAREPVVVLPARELPAPTSIPGPGIRSPR